MAEPGTASPGRAPGQNRAGLVRYVAAATLARGADGGAAVGLVLLAVHPATGLGGGARIGGLLAAGLTAPHLLGPWLARHLDRARDGRTLLAASFAVYGLALATGAVLLGRASPWLVALPVLVAGTCGPLLTGGLSSRLAGIVGPDHRTQRRAEGWDALSYGMGGTAGPAAVAGLAAVATPLGALLTLCAAAVVAGALTLTLPRGARPTDVPDGDALSVRAALRLMVARGPLRRVSVATLLTAISLGGVSVVAVTFGAGLSDEPAAGAALVAAFGLGNLAGSLVLTAFPLHGEPERLTVRHVALMAAAFGACAIAPNYPVALIAFGVAGASNAPFFTATLAARSEYSPSGARAQIFVSLAGLKVAMSSAGTALAGVVAFAGPRVLLLGGAAVTAAAAVIAVVDRRLAGDVPVASSAAGAERR